MREISRYRVSTGVPDEWQPGSSGRVLRNLLGITQPREMDQVEYGALLVAQSAWLGAIDANTRFTSRMLRQMHRDWLGGIYSWAGRHRDVELAKGGFRWPPARLVGRNMAAFSRTTLRSNTPCHATTVHEAARRIAVVHAELLLIHPFRDGNGRLARWLSDLMAFQAGLPAPEYPFVGRGTAQERRTYLRAVKRAYAADFDLLVAFFLDAFARAARIRR